MWCHAWGRNRISALTAATPIMAVALTINSCEWLWMLHIDGILFYQLFHTRNIFFLSATVLSGRFWPDFISMEIMQRRCACNPLQRRQLSEMKSFNACSYFVVILPLWVGYHEKHMQIERRHNGVAANPQILLQSFHFREIIFTTFWLFDTKTHSDHNENFVWHVFESFR